MPGGWAAATLCFYADGPRRAALWQPPLAVWGDGRAAVTPGGAAQPLGIAPLAPLSSLARTPACLHGCLLACHAAGGDSAGSVELARWFDGMNDTPAWRQLIATRHQCDVIALAHFLPHQARWYSTLSSD